MQVSGLACSLLFKTDKGSQEYPSNPFQVAIVSHAQVTAVPTKTIVHRIIRGLQEEDAVSDITVEARDLENNTVINSFRVASVRGLNGILQCCCYLGDCTRFQLEAGVARFPSIKPSQVNPHFMLLFNLTTPFSTKQAHSATFQVVHDAPSRFAVTKIPEEASAGSIFEVQVQVGAALLNMPL